MKTIDITPKKAKRSGPGRPSIPLENRKLGRTINFKAPLDWLESIRDYATDNKMTWGEACRYLFREGMIAEGIETRPLQAGVKKGHIV